MKKKILIFRSKVPIAHRSTAYRLETGLQKLGLDDYQQVYYHQLVVNLRSSSARAFIAVDNQLKPLQADLAYIHGFSAPDIRQFLATYLQENDIKLINSENLYNMPTSKLNQYYAFCKNDVPYPDTIAASPLYFELVADYFSINYPMVVKGANAKRGNDNYLIKNSGELRELSGSLDPQQQFVLQPFVPNDGDYRYIVFQDQIVACYKRSRDPRSDEHRNNVSKGGKRQMIDEPLLVHKQAAIAAAKVLKRQLTGIDIVADKDGRPYVLESNFNFGLKDEGDGIYEQVLERLAPMIHQLASS